MSWKGGYLGGSTIVGRGGWSTVDPAAVSTEITLVRSKKPIKAQKKGSAIGLIGHRGKTGRELRLHTVLGRTARFLERLHWLSLTTELYRSRVNGLVWLKKFEFWKSSLESKLRDLET
jgi:hypothetical protein